ncbi:MAG: lipopolysaccharide transport periplasmic protein LptA [Rubrivivax sp.]
MTHRSPLLRRVAPFALALLCAAAVAERADRERQMVVEADRPGSVDLQRQVVEFNGNVVITQGTMIIRADRVELRETSDGYRAATALGTPGHQASYRQKRDGVDEIVEGQADRIEYDGRADTLRFIGNGAVRRLRGSIVSDEITGSQIVWDNTAETFNVAGGQTTSANPSGRVRAVLSPRADGSASAASAPASAAPLAPSRTLGTSR